MSLKIDGLLKMGEDEEDKINNSGVIIIIQIVKYFKCR